MGFRRSRGPRVPPRHRLPEIMGRGEPFPHGAPDPVVTEQDLSVQQRVDSVPFENGGTAHRGGYLPVRGVLADRGFDGPSLLARLYSRWFASDVCPESRAGA